MYLVVHEDEVRGAAIVAALGADPVARLVGSSIDAFRFAETDGRPHAVLACPDAADAFLVAAELPAEPDLKGVPILYDGGGAGPVYRAFVRQWRAQRSFHHLRDATPAQAAEALRALAPEAPVVEKRGPGLMGQQAMALVLLGYVAARFLPPAWLPPGAGRIASGLLLLAAAGSYFGLPILAAVRRGIRPSVGALVILAAILLSSGESLRDGFRAMLGR